MPEAVSAAPVITGGEPGSFARSVLAERHPALIRQVRDAFPYPPEQQRALDTLQEETAHGLIGALPAGAFGGEQWAGWAAEYVGRSWFDVPFLWAESYFYRRLLEAVGYFGPGPWQGVDPFAPFKRAELHGAAVDAELAALDDVAGLPQEARDQAVLGGALWGNRADLGFRISSGGPGNPGGPGGSGEPGNHGHPGNSGGPGGSGGLGGSGGPGGSGGLGNPGGPGGSGEPGGSGNPGGPGASVRPRASGAADAHVIADDSGPFWAHLAASAAAPTRTPTTPTTTPTSTTTPTTVHLVADNAGRELIPDLILLDHLLHTGRAEKAVLHVKPYPYYVSDATTADVVDCLRRITGAPGQAGKIGARLWEAITGGRLAVRGHSFFCAPLPYADMPGDLRADLAGAAVAIVKGDLNYRRLVGDRHWPATASFAALTAYFPGPLLALRTLKCDVAVGLAPRTLAALEEGGEAWRTSGTHAVIQFRP